MEGVGDEVREGWGRGGSGGWWRLVGAVEQVVDVASAHLCSLLMTVVGVLRGYPNGNRTRMRKEGGRTGCRGRVVDVGGWGVEVEVEMGLLTTWVGGLPM
jgi:hypothetical protein